jgi:hypothetical protein
MVGSKFKPSLPIERNQIMKKLIVLTLVLSLLAITIVPAFAAASTPARIKRGGGAGTGKGGNAPFALAGTIASLDPVARTVTVTVVSGNKLVKPYIGQNLTLQTSDATRFLLRNPDSTATLITFADLAVGQKVSANGQLANNVWTVSRITVGAELTCLP